MTIVSLYKRPSNLAVKEFEAVMERLLACSSLKVGAPICESPAVNRECNLSVRRGFMQLDVPGRRTPIPLRCMRWDEVRIDRAYSVFSSEEWDFTALLLPSFLDLLLLIRIGKIKISL